jgi:hypothetical protein
MESQSGGSRPRSPFSEQVDAMMDRLLSSLVAISLALLVWLYARSRDQEVLDNVPIPVQVVVNPAQADHYHLELTGPNQVPVSFTGPPARIRELQGMLQRKELHAVLTVNVPDERLGEGRYVDAVVLEASDLHAPMGVTPIVAEGRNRIPFVLHRLVERRLPVRFDSLREGVCVPVILDPPTVLVRGPKEVLDRVHDIPTQPSELPERPLNASPGAPALGRVPLVTELEGRPVRVLPTRVLARVPTQMRKVYELPDVPIQFLCPPKFQFTPTFTDERSSRVTLRVQGPVQEEPPKVFVFIDLSRGRYDSGLNHEPLQIQLPKDFQLAEDPPRVATFELRKADFVPGGLNSNSP